MTQLDRVFDALFRNTIGFEHLSDFMSRGNQSFPHYNIIKVDPFTHTLEVALAGYKPQDIEIEWAEGKLTISSFKDTKDALMAFVEDNSYPQHMHRGVSGRNFKLAFALQDHVEVDQAEFDNGLLRVSLVRNVPEALQPKKIPITVAGPLENKSETSARRKIKAA